VPSWDDLQHFLACHRGWSATRAARALDTSVSTVVRRLDRLEAELGCALFLRGADGLTPTDAGERMLEAALEAERRVLEAFASAPADAEAPAGEVRLAATADLANHVLLPTFASLLTRHPALSVQLVLGPELSDISRREADIAVRIGDPGATGDLIVRHLRDEPMCVFGAEDYFASQPPDLPLSAHRWVALGEGLEGTPMARWQAARTAGAPTPLRTNDLTSLRLAAAAGLGLAVLPRMYGLITPRLVELVVPAPPPPVPLFLVTHRATRRSPAVRAVVDHLVDLLVPRPGRDEAGVLRAALAAAYGWSGWTDANHSSENVRPVRRE
jgi:DNA-binding transcriptional LysR family regulator